MDPADRVVAALLAHGILFKQDKSLPSVVGILTGESLKGSWWSHPKGRLIFAVLSRLADHPDVLFTKLLYRKDTLVHRTLWPSLLAVGRSREPWQVAGLSAGAKRILKALDEGDADLRASGPAVKEVEMRLLAAAREEHTESGRHEMRLVSWQTWSSRAGCRPARSVIRARAELERAASSLGAPPEALPWPTPPVGAGESLRRG
jgi:hypothetical protein